jgi:DNA-binding IclR family transcriptional regulator
MKKPWPMKKSKLSDQRLMRALLQAETGIPVGKICRKTDIGEATFFRLEEGLQRADAIRGS